MLRASTIALTAALCAAGAGAADDKIGPDRANATTGTGIVEPGHIQVEAGATWERSRDQRQWTLGDVNIRVPLGAQTEVHIGLPSYLLQRGSSRVSGLDDTPVEARWRCYQGDTVELAVLAMAMLPTGARRVAERNAQPGAVLAAVVKPSDMLELAFNLGARRASHDGRRFTQASAAFALSVDVGERWNAFAEVYGVNREDRGGPSQKFAAAGAIYFIGKDTAVDARVGKGIHNGTGTDTLASMGVSHRF